MNKRYIPLLALFLLLALLAGGCANTGISSNPAEVTTVTDSLGEEVSIPKDVTKVASMRSGITEIICALGQADKIIAVDEMVKAGQMYGAFITRVYPELTEKSAPYAGNDINTEEMLKLDPDLVLHGGYGRIKQAETLKEQAPDLPVVIAHFETLDAYMDDIRIVGQCVNAEERAEELITYLEMKLGLIETLVKGIPEAEKVRVFYGGHDTYHAYTSDTFEHAQIVAAGGVNVAGELTGWLPSVSAEQLLQWDPEVIILLNGASVAEVLNDEQLTGLSAVKERRVYALPEAGWDFSSPRALFCIEWLAGKFYPEQFSNIDMDTEADEFYNHVFGVDYAGPELDDVELPSEIGESRVFTDMNGRTVEIPIHPRRITSVYPDVTTAILVLNRPDVLAGIDTLTAKSERQMELFPILKSLPDAGVFYNMNEEGVLLTEPEILLTAAWQFEPDKFQENLGVPVVCIDLNYYKESIDIIADILGDTQSQARAAEISAYYDAKIGAVHESIKDVEERTKVYIGGSDSVLSTFGRESTWHYEIEDAGAINVSADILGGGSHEISMEQVILWDPDVIVLDQTCVDTVEDVLADPQWADVTAVKEGRVYRASPGFLDSWGRPNLESLLSRLWLADKCYPDLVNLDMQAEAREFYATIYGAELSDAEIEAIINP
ncbi:MAG: ABC transporter substrate-binding protein [Anaerolineae bacterium]|nr:ABC transporter substrate-binding protein [Anaerolineae bacterium]